MEKCIKIGSESVILKASAGALITYKSQFGSDYIEDSAAVGTGEKFDFRAFLNAGCRLLWAMAKNADKSILPPDEWFEELGNFDLKGPLEEANALFLKSLEDIENEGSSGEPLTAEKLIAYSAVCGMSLADLDALPLSMVVNAIDDYVGLRYGSDKPSEATQADFDAF